MAGKYTLKNQLKIMKKVELNDSLVDLMVYIGECRDVKEWNAKRQEAKELFTQRAINALDASGHVSKAIR
jgi:hypothetical protein